MVNRIGNNTGLPRIVNAAFYSMAGLRAAWRNEAAFRQECVLVVVLFPAALWLGQNAVERALLVCCLLLILIVELINSAVESAIDRIGSEPHSLSGRAKDLGSAAVFVCLVMSGAVWGLVAWERFF